MSNLKRKTMSRVSARELAVRLCCADEETASAVGLELFFEPAYFSSLAAEDELFELPPSTGQEAYIRQVVLGVTEHRAELDAAITEHSKEWRIDRISRLALAVLRVAMFESLYVKGVDTGTAINAAIDILKKYDTVRTVKFVNGILGSFSRAGASKTTLTEQLSEAGEPSRTDDVSEQTCQQEAEETA
jgi:N utilization substance protein B